MKKKPITFADLVGGEAGFKEIFDKGFDEAVAQDRAYKKTVKDGERVIAITRAQFRMLVAGRRINAGTIAAHYATLAAAHHLNKKRIAELEKRLAEIETKGIRYRGIYQRADEYRRGDVVTHGGSAWVAVSDVAKGAPGASDCWQLMVKSK